MMCLGIESAIFKEEKGLQMQGSGSEVADS